jgi:hypothetical protein
MSMVRIFVHINIGRSALYRAMLDFNNLCVKQRARRAESKDIKIISRKQLKPRHWSKSLKSKNWTKIKKLTAKNFC